MGDFFGVGQQVPQREEELLALVGEDVDLEHLLGVCGAAVLHEEDEVVHISQVLGDLHRHLFVETVDLLVHEVDFLDDLAHLVVVDSHHVSIDHKSLVLELLGVLQNVVELGNWGGNSVVVLSLDQGD